MSATSKQPFPKRVSSFNAEAVLAAMGYIDATQCCDKCRHFTGPDYSGNIQSRHNLCTLNPAIDLEVDPSGRCDHFKAKNNPSSKQP